jgi:hypothetical protein
MAKTHDVGNYFWHTLVYPIKPSVIFDKAETQEIEEPFRGGKGWAIRLPFTRLAIVLGRWNEIFSESSALTRAVVGRPMSQDEVDWDMLRYGAPYEDI